MKFLSSGHGESQFHVLWRSVKKHSYISITVVCTSVHATNLNGQDANVLIVCKLGRERKKIAFNALRERTQTHIESERASEIKRFSCEL